MEIETRELRDICNKLIDHLESIGVTSFTLTEDYYWCVDMKELYNIKKEPQHFTLGQLFDDWEWLKRVHDGTDDPIPFALVWLSSILRYLGHKVP